MADITVSITAQDNFSSVLGNFGNIITGIKSAIDLIGDAFQFASDAIAPFINSASESEQAITRLEGILRATGSAAGLTSEQLQGIASHLQDVTRFSDEEVMSSEALMLTFRNISGDVFPRAIEAAVDMAEVFGSLDSATMQLGKALQDPVSMMGALSRAGVTFSDAQKEMIKNFVETGNVAAAQDIILSEVEAQVGSLAEAMGKTFAGQLAIAKNKLDEIRETIGAAVLPAFTSLLSKLSEFAAKPEVVKFFQDVSDSITRFIDSLGLTDKLETFLNLITTAMQTGNWQPVWDTIVKTFDTIKTKILELFSGAGGFDIQGKIQELVNMFTTAIASADWTTVGHTLSGILMGAISITMKGLDIIINGIDWKPAGIALKNALGEMWTAAWRDMLAAGNTKSAVEGMQKEAQEDLKQFGRDMAQGLVDGFNSWKISFADWVRDHIITPIKQALGISSPSTVFMEIGRNIILGLMAGFMSSVGFLITLVGQIVGLILAPFKPILDLLNIDLGGITGSVTGSLGGASGTSNLGHTGGTTGTHNTGGVGSGGEVVNNYYGPVYFQGAGEPGAYYDCPSDVPLTVGGSTGGLVRNGAR